MIINDVQEKEMFQLKSYTRHKPERPKNIGYMNIYIRKPSRDGSRQPFKRFRFPTVCYKRHHFRKFDSLVNIMPWNNIYFDRRSQQTIIYSLKGGVCILPPLINVHDQLFSVAELIAFGYASLTRTGVRPILTGPNVPQINGLTGVFDGGVRTGYGSFP
ncbi:unnamed protein product, partial [Adineta steineri]